jgi:hypothetical protein
MSSLGAGRFPGSWFEHDRGYRSALFDGIYVSQNPTRLMRRSLYDRRLPDARCAQIPNVWTNAHRDLRARW